MEYGIIIPQGIKCIRKNLPDILEDGENRLTAIFREHFSALYDEMVHLDERVETLEQSLKTICNQNEDCKRLLTIPGIGLMTATALIAAIGDIRAPGSLPPGWARSPTTFHRRKADVARYQQAR